MPATPNPLRRFVAAAAIAAALPTAIVGLALTTAHQPADELADVEACGYVTYTVGGSSNDVPGLSRCEPPCFGIWQGPGHVGTGPRVDFYACVTGL